MKSINIDAVPKHYDFKYTWSANGCYTVIFWYLNKNSVRIFQNSANLKVGVGPVLISATEFKFTWIQLIDTYRIAFTKSFLDLFKILFGTKVQIQGQYSKTVQISKYISAHRCIVYEENSFKPN